MSNVSVELWPNGVVPYLLSLSITEEPARLDAVRRAMKLWSEGTPVSFREWKPGDADYIEIRATDGWGESAVGRGGGGQSVFLSKPVTVGEALHELGHVLGLHHEHTRHDRADYLHLYPERTTSPAIRKELETIQHRADRDRLYDYGSVMHWPRAPGPPGSPVVMEPRDPSAIIGQRERLGRGDRQSLAILYP